jgi:hypothetical protein
MKTRLAIVAIALVAFEPTTATAQTPVRLQAVVNPLLALDCIQIARESANTTLFYRERPTSRPPGVPPTYVLAQDVRKALPVEVRRAIPAHDRVERERDGSRNKDTDTRISLPGENTWQWLKRQGFCDIGPCEGGGFAFLNWTDAQPPVYDNVEVEPDAPLVASRPFAEPKPGDLFFDERAEQEIKTRMRNGVHDIDTMRVFRRGVFIGYTRRTNTSPLITI